MNNPLVFDVSGLLDKGTGRSEKFSVDGKIRLEDIEFKGNFVGNIEIMRIEDGFNVRIFDAKLKIKQKCEKCLASYTQEIQIDSVERQFYIDQPEHFDDPNDTFLIDKKHLTLDVSEMLRQEIILHFPSNLVCSSHCKGICPVCGKNRNKEKCDCKPINEDVNTVKSLSKLKDLIK